MSLRALLALTSLAALAACEPEQPVTPPTPPATASPVAAPPASASAAAPASSSYAGHGLGSVSPEILAKYAPTPMPSEVTRRIQAMIDVRAPSAGRLSPDGKTLYVSWAITGTRQVFRIDGPQRFPV